MVGESWVRKSSRNTSEFPIRIYLMQKFNNMNKISEPMAKDLFGSDGIVMVLSFHLATSSLLSSVDVEMASSICCFMEEIFS